MPESPFYWFLQLEDWKGNPIPGTAQRVPRDLFPAHCQPERIARAYAEARQNECPDACSYYLAWSH